MFCMLDTDEKLRSSSPSNEVASQLREAKRKLEQELSTMKYRLKTSEEEKDKVNQKVGIFKLILFFALHTTSQGGYFIFTMYY